MRRSRAACVVLALGLGAAPLAAGLGPAAAAERADYPCSDIRPDSPAAEAASASTPFGLLRVQEAWDVLDRGGLPDPGRGIGVAVLDSPVSTTNPHLRVERGAAFATSPGVIGDYHGTAVAGLVAAAARPASGGSPRLPVGLAPGARIVDVPFFDVSSASTDDTQVTPETMRLVAALNWVAANARRRGIGVATVAVGVPDSPGPELRDAVRRVLAADVVLVAPTGDRPTEDGAPFSTRFGSEGPGPGEDAARDVFPAAFEGQVLAVNATAEGSDQADASTAVLLSSATDVAAPTYGAVTTSLARGTCVLTSVSSGFAAAEVSGLVALVRQRFPDENARQVMARVIRTASGTPRTEDPLTGAGVVQPVEALRRELRPARDGALQTAGDAGNDQPGARAPKPAPDVLAPTRREAVWVGLLGAAAIAIAAMLRPLVARLRRP